jgi:Ni,Fe-hydrogenase III small subunit/ferredoxin
MPWISRGIREGIVTSKYPHRPDGYGDNFRSAVNMRPALPHELTSVEATCPTGAIFAEGRARLDRGKCILCGRCTGLLPEVFAWTAGFETATLARHQLVVPEDVGDEAALAEVRNALGVRVKALRRSVHVRHVDAGSDGAEESEIAALTNPVYDVQRLGIFLTASPRHADILLATGVGTTGMTGALRETYDAMPGPKVVIAAGVDAISGGMVGQGYASAGGVGSIVPVDIFIPGSPPSPFSLLHGLLLALAPLAGNTAAPGQRRESLSTAQPRGQRHAEGPPDQTGGSRP